MGVTAAIIGAIGSIAGGAIGGALSGGGGGGGGGSAPHVDLLGVNLADPNVAGLDAFTNQGAEWDRLSQFTTRINQTGLTQYTNLLNQLYPGATSQLGTISSLADSYLKGQIPQDVQQQISRASAQQAMTGGYPFSGMASAGQLRNLGMTSMEGQQLGANLYQTGLGAAKGMIPGFVNPASLLFSPAQLLARTDQANYYNTDVKNQQQIIDAQLKEQQQLTQLASKSQSQSGISSILGSILGSGGGGSGGGGLGGILSNFFGSGSGGLSGTGLFGNISGGGFGGNLGGTVGSFTDTGGGGVSDFSSLFGSATASI